MKRVSLTMFMGFTFLTSFAQQKKPNILWITCEDISPFIGAYGDKVVKTPHIDQLAKEGIRYTNVFTTAGVCAPSRAAIVTGMYQTSIGAQHMRTLPGGPGSKKDSLITPYSAVIPDYVKCFPEYLRMAGYYCTNNEKQDYQFEAPATVWDENGPAASYRNRPEEKPFFSVFNFFITHESQIFLRKDSLLVHPENVQVPLYYPDTKMVRHDIARLLTNIEIMDQQVGALINMLKKDGLYDNTIIFFYSDHGGALPWMKREILERGTHIPFIIRLPHAEKATTTNDDLVNAVDFAPTVLSLAGVRVPAYMQGQAFLGDQRSTTPRQYVYAARDRMDERYDRVRMVRDKKFRYLYNYMPEQLYYQDISFRIQMPLMKEILTLRDNGKLNPTQMGWFMAKPVEELYDVEHDPDELQNLAADPAYRSKLVELRAALRNWIEKVGDMGAISEKEMVKQMWNGADTPPLTAVPEVIDTTQGVKLVCKTKGASIGYRIVRSQSQQLQEREIISWDGSMLANKVKNGDKMKIPAPWNVYNGEVITLQKGDILQVNAMRIGFKAAGIVYKDGNTITER